VFEVDVSRAPDAIRQLEHARDELKDIKREALALGQVSAPAADEVSVDAAAALGRVAVGNDRSFVQALDEGIAEMERMISALGSAFSAYHEGQSDGARSFSSRL
jgi:hypothetical protein